VGFARGGLRLCAEECASRQVLGAVRMAESAELVAMQQRDGRISSRGHAF